MSETPDDKLLAEIEDLAATLARRAGGILGRYFSASMEVRYMEVRYKDEGRTDPVTAADTESEEYISRIVAERYPGHGVLGEEGAEDGNAVAPDFVWAIDPLDGTNNFVGGLPVFACSIGVLYRGAPVVGAVYVPWPGEAAGRVFHARKGGGAFLNEDRLEPLAAEAGDGRLVTLPGSFRGAFKMGKQMQGKVGEVRVLGSIAYELAMVAGGVLRYSVVGKSSLWDVAAGAAIVAEVGGDVRIGRRECGRRPLSSAGIEWRPLTTLVDGWQTGTTTLGELRRWSSPMILGRPDVVAGLVAAVTPRRNLLRRLRHPLRRR